MGKDHAELIQDTKPMGIQVTPVAQINLLEPCTVLPMLEMISSSKNHHIAFIDRVW
jgi:hypothetical protein